MRFVLLNLITFLLISGCAEPILDLANKNLAAMTQANLVQFGSNENFKHYLAALQKAQPSKKNIPNGALASTSEAAADSSGSITNNQELGVDEGDIVKKMGDYLIVLRRGRLFSLNLDNLAPIHNIDTFPEGSSGQGTWYDEILTNDNKIIVIGYSYNVSATEIGIFDLSDSGELSHNQTFYLRSNDYYSSRNYASRLVDGKLIFYMPYSFISHDFDDNLEITLPAQATRNANGRVNNWDNIIDTSNIFMPIQETNYPVMHSVITCELDNFNCSAQSVIGPSSRNFYVSPNAVYLWVSENKKAKVYKMPLDGSHPGFIDAKGSPIDQFSFKEQGSYLNVLLQNTDSNQNSLALMKVDLNKFDFWKLPFVPWEHKYKNLPAPSGYSIQNRFVGDYILYGSALSSFYSFESQPNNCPDTAGCLPPNDKQIFHFNFKKFPDKYPSIALSHNVERIDIMGDNAVVVGKNGRDLYFSSLDLKNFDKPRVLDIFVQQNATQGESRSHGFFFNKNSGILGLPTRENVNRYSSLYKGSAEVLYLKVNDGKFSKLGSLESQANNTQGDNCAVSCADWYGNARPIFIEDRILALLGYELVEGALNAEDSIKEIDRVNFMPGINSGR